METETETIKVIHILNQGFDWRFVVKPNPEFPEHAILIEQHADEEMRASVSVPVEALHPIQVALESFVK